MSGKDDPWSAGWADSPDWLMRRHHELFRTLCPACGYVGRPYKVGPDTRDVRCAACNLRFDPAGRVPATTGRNKR